LDQTGPDRTRKLLQVLSLVTAVGSIAFFALLPADSEVYIQAGYVGVFVVTVISGVLPGPSLIVVFMAGRLLDPLPVSLIAGFGSAVGETVGYLVGYGSLALPSEGFAVSERWVKTRWYVWFQQKIVGWMRRNIFLTIFGLAAVPNIFVDIASIIAGRNRYPYPLFFAAMFLGKTIRFAQSAFLGAFSASR
jgi:membrane protein YqaA with SNARE-associated domain